ncbi:hypothetical protein BH10PLA1_BH10PLA1_03130 [soil metagenome]
MAIEIDQYLVTDAAAGKSRALRAIIGACYPAACRISIALVGDTTRGLAIVKQLVSQSMKAAEQWEDPSSPMRWFVHHAVLNARQAGAVEGDILLAYATAKQLPYVAFMRGLRKLPRQQIEAIILHYGEAMDDRQLAVAMDCSTVAASQHLQAAELSLKQISGDEFAERCRDLKVMYDGLSPDPGAVFLYVADRVNAYVRPRVAAKWIRRAMIAIVVAVATYCAWMAFEYMSR